MYIALKSFCGQITMRRGEIKDIMDPVVISDLLRAGYIEKIDPKVESDPPEDPLPPVAKVTKKKKKKK